MYKDAKYLAIFLIYSDKKMKWAARRSPIQSLCQSDSAAAKSQLISYAQPIRGMQTVVRIQNKLPYLCPAKF